MAALDLNEEGLATLGDGILTLAVDTSDPDRVGEAFVQVENSLGPAYILATAAAIWAGWNSIVDMDYDDVERIFRINTFGTLYCVKNAARQMIGKEPRRAPHHVVVDRRGPRPGPATSPTRAARRPSRAWPDPSPPNSPTTRSP